MKRSSFTKNIYKRGNQYYVEKSINNEKYYFGTFDTLNEAIIHRDKVKANGWKQVPLTDEQQHKHDVKEYFRNISIDCHKTQYRVHCSNKWFGNVNTIEEALYYRDFVMKQGVDKKPKELDLITDNPYLKDGLKYPLPERLIKPERNSKYGKGHITQKGPCSFHIYYGSNRNGNNNYICTCQTYEMAEYVRMEMMKIGWDKSKLDKIIKDYPKYYTYLMYFYQYITKDKNAKGELTGRYCVVPPVKMNDDKLEYIKYNNLEDALYERDFLKENNWDYDLLVETIDDNKNPYYDMELPPWPTRRIRRVKERDFHEKELTEVIRLYKEGYGQTEISEMLDITAVTFRNWLKIGYNSSWSEFTRLIDDGVNPLRVLEKQEIIYQPDLSRTMPPNFNHYVSRKLGEYGLRWIVSRKGTYFGCYPSKELAHKISDELSKVDWDKSKLKKIQAKHGFTSMVGSRRWVYPNGKSWSVRRKNKEKRMLTYGSWRDKRIAEIVRDMLIKYGWELENMDWIEDIAVWTVHCMDLYNSSMFGKITIEDIEYLELESENVQHVYFINGKYDIKKIVKGKVVHFGRYNTKGKSMQVVEFLKDNNWDKELLEVMQEMGEI